MLGLKLNHVSKSGYRGSFYSHGLAEIGAQTNDLENSLNPNLR